MTSIELPKEQHCTFCGEGDRKVGTLVSSGGAYICRSCNHTAALCFWDEDRQKERTQKIIEAAQ